MMEDEYESLPEHIPSTTHMMAGAAAGIAEHSMMYPFDCIKTRMQTLKPEPRADYRNVVEAFYKIVKQEGFRRPFRGMGAVVGGAGPAHAMYFASYEAIKKRLSKDHAGHGSAVTQAGGCSTIFHDAIMNPAEVIKQRMQVYNSPYTRCVECGHRVMRKEGMRAFYRSFKTQMLMNVPFHSLHFVTYEYMQDVLNEERHYHPGTHIISGALAGAVAAGSTTPLDVCKTLLNTQEKCAIGGKHVIHGLGQAARTVYHHHGFGGFGRGLSARIIFQMPGTAISWGMYEFFKYTISMHRLHAGEEDKHSAALIDIDKDLLQDRSIILEDNSSNVIANER